MVLSVNSSTKVALGFATVAAFGLGTVLFYRYHVNAVVQLTTPSLDKERFSLADIPLIGGFYSYFNSTKSDELPIYTLGSQSSPFTTVEKLAKALAELGKQRRLNGALVVYGDNLNITLDPGIIALKPMKVILVGAHIADTSIDNSLGQLMMKNGWFASRSRLVFVEVASVEEAIKAALPFNHAISEPRPTVYNVRV